jgi:hypothetical protein
METSATERRDLGSSGDAAGHHCDEAFERIERHMRHSRWMLALIYILQLMTFIQPC